VVFKPMKRRDVVKALESNGCTAKGQGRHTVYVCPCGQHKAPVPASHTTIIAGVVKSIGNQMACLKEGWLQ
jgi:predicted RNA binding protein YcfA (HicA-like mRNA interferase family)